MDLAKVNYEAAFFPTLQIHLEIVMAESRPKCMCALGTVANRSGAVPRSSPTNLLKLHGIAHEQRRLLASTWQMTTLRCGKTE